MNCDTCRDRLVDWLEEGADPEVRDHLASCAGCKALFDSAESAAQTLEAATAPRPRSTWNDLVRRMEPAPKIRRRWPYGIAAAAALVVAVIGIFASPGGNDRPPRKLRIQVVDAQSRVSSSDVDAVLEELEP